LVAPANTRERDGRVHGPRDALVQTGAVEELERAAAAEPDRTGRLARDLQPRVGELLVQSGRIDLERTLLQRHLDEVPVLVGLAVPVDAQDGAPVIGSASSATTAVCSTRSLGARRYCPRLDGLRAV